MSIYKHAEWFAEAACKATKLTAVACDKDKIKGAYVTTTTGLVSKTFFVGTHNGQPSIELLGYGDGSL